MNYNGFNVRRGVREAKSELFISSQAGGIGGLGDTKEGGYTASNQALCRKVFYLAQV